MHSETGGFKEEKNAKVELDRIRLDKELAVAHAADKVHWKIFRRQLCFGICLRYGGK